MIGRLLVLLGGCAAFYLLVGLPARHLGGGDAVLIFLGTGLLLCLVPGVLTLVWGGRALRQSPDKQLILVMGGMGLRMAFVLLAGLVLFQYVPYYQRQGSFLLWLAVSYLFTLALDMIVLLAGRAQQEEQAPATRSPIS